MKKTVSFDDVLLEPRYSDITTRKDIDLSIRLNNLGYNLSTPIISAPMDSITDANMAAAMSSLGGLGIIHRYYSVEDQEKEVSDAIAAGAKIVGAAVGISGDYLKRAISLAKAGADVICVDVAHGHHAMMKLALAALRNDPYTRDLHLMAGNVATLEGFNDLADWGANSIRVGIGGGSICSTRVQTGHGVPTLQSVIDCANSDRDALLIADGGIKNSGDMVKALAAGADLLMCGSLLSGTDETPGEIIRPLNGPPRKVYRGMASREAQKSWREKVSSVEGVATTVPVKGTVENVVKDLDWGIRSGLSYSGCRTLQEFRSKSNFIIQTSAGTKESNTHILSVI